MSSHKSMENLSFQALAGREGTRHPGNEAPKLSPALSMENISANSVSANQGRVGYPYGCGNQSSIQYVTDQYPGYPAVAQGGLLPTPPTLRNQSPNLSYQGLSISSQFANTRATGYHSAAALQRQRLYQPQYPTPLLDLNPRQPEPQRRAREADSYPGDGKQRQGKGERKTKLKHNNDEEIKDDTVNDSSSSEEDELDEHDVFRVLVKEFGGVCKPKLLRRKFNHLSPSFDFTSWLETHEHRFRILRKGQSSGVKVVAFFFKATTCLDYCRMNKERKPCSNKRCQHYHVCKDYITGNCSYDHCRYSHDFYDGRNRSLTEKNKLNSFSNEEIRIIASFRYPKVCKEYNLPGGCPDAFCNNLHICKQFALGRCLKGSECDYEHRFKSKHNQTVIKAYKMSQILEKSEPLFRKLIYVWRDPPEEKADRSRAETKSSPFLTDDDHETFNDRIDVQMKDGRTQRPEDGILLRRSPILTKVDQGTKQEEKQRKKKGEQKKQMTTQEVGINTDLADRTALCDAVLMNKCNRGNCRSKLHHCLSLQLPYCWQINLYGSWITLGKQDNINVEKAFCCLKNRSENFQISHDDVEYEAYIDFQTPHRGNVFEKALGQDTLITDIFVRRLSTKSHVEANVNTPSFLTQWRWYWELDHQWCLLESNTLQVTLEQKYTSGQTKYLFRWSDNNHFYRLYFGSMVAENVDTNQRHDVRRRPLFVDNGDIMRQSVPSSLEIPPVALPTKPPSWDPWDLDNPYEIVELDPESREYEHTANVFYKSMNKEQFPIDNICRVQNPTLWRNFTTEEDNRTIKDAKGKQTKMAKRNLFHGTDSIDVVHGICRNGFDDRLAGKNQTRYGEGAYFAIRANYSHNYTEEDLTGKRYMFRAKVLVGEYCEGKREYKRPPSKPENKHELYDSCVDNEANPTIFVVFECSHSYPEYLIQYKENRMERNRDTLTDEETLEKTRQPESQSDVEVLYKPIFKQELKQAKSDMKDMSTAKAQWTRSAEGRSFEDTKRPISPLLTSSRRDETSVHQQDDATLNDITDFGF